MPKSNMTTFAYAKQHLTIRRCGRPRSAGRPSSAPTLAGCCPFGGIPSKALSKASKLKVWLVICGAVTANALCCGGAWAAAEKAQTAGCSLSITSPTGGENVDGMKLASGEATLPPGTFLWLFAHLKGQSGWVPQGGGPTSIDPDTGLWNAMITYGEPPNIGFDFEVLAEVVTGSADAQLVKYVSEANETNRFPPIPAPTPAPNCRGVKITVHKVS